MNVTKDSNNDKAVGDNDDEHPYQSVNPVIQMLLHHRLQYQDFDSPPRKSV